MAKFLHSVLITVSVTSLKEGAYVFTCVCLSVCPSVSLYARLLKKLETDFVEIVWSGGAWAKDQLVRLDVDPDNDLEPGIFLKDTYSRLFQVSFFTPGGSTNLSRVLCFPNPSNPSACWSIAPHAVVLTLMREHYYCVYLYMLCRLMY